MHIPSFVPICAAGLPYQRELERLSNRAETTGCDRRGFRFAVALPYLICRTADGGFSVRCPVCAARVVAIAVQEIGEDPWVDADRQWFVAHPKRRWRLREAFPGRSQHPARHLTLMLSATWCPGWRSTARGPDRGDGGLPDPAGVPRSAGARSDRSARYWTATPTPA